MTNITDKRHRTEPGSPARLTHRANVRVMPSSPDYPRSYAANYTRLDPVTPEEDLLRNLKHEWRRLPDNEPTLQTPRPKRVLIIADLHDFEVYRCPDSDKRRPSELTSLHLFDVKAKNLCFDGYIRLSHAKYYVERIQIDDLSIEGYGSKSDPGIVLYLQTRLASKDATSDVWLRLRQPASRYERFHSPFIWVAVLGKHVLDYMDEYPRNTVHLESFEFGFHEWLVKRFGQNNNFREWLRMSGNASDFRVAFHAYAEFLYNQARNMSNSKHLTSHPIWAQCKCNRMTAIERHPNLVKDTLATPHVYQCFEQMYFASKLKQVAAAAAVSKVQRKRKARLGFAEDCTPPLRPDRRDNGGTVCAQVRVGNVVSILPDEVDRTNWKKSGDEWLAYVQGVEPAENGGQRLLVLWLYRPADTNISLAKYLYTNELFLSDNCNCGEREILSTDTIRKHSVEWSPQSPDTAGNFFVRQTYITRDSAFVTVRDDHKTCRCRKPRSSTKTWRAGDTVYITKTTDGQQLLEPVVIHEIDFTTKEAKVRALLRLARDCSNLAAEAERSNVAPNELVLTGQLKILPISRIKRACHVRLVQKLNVLKDKVPFPYNLGGAGDHWFVSMGLESTDGIQRLVFLERLPKGFHEAQETPLPHKKLRGLSLFSGGGGLDRGLEEGGAVEFQTSVDYDSAAIHTQRANCRDPQNMRLFCGSVDDYIKSLLSADKNRSVARVGEVDLVAAGSPCPGFSALQQNILSKQSLTYASHVTTFCTAVDVYRPLYGVLENVVNMASTRTGLEEQNVLSQLVACLVSIGYQVNQYIMDSWTYGSCQRRSRIILTVAAPHLEPILQRPHTHSRSYKDTAARSLGRLPNGERFGDREHYATPFPYVTAEDAMSDLPNIGNGNVQTCIRFPDHRLSRPTNSKTRALIECIPRHPPGYGYAEAFELDLVPPSLRMTKKETDNSYRRIKANGLIPTITTDINMQDARNGASVHWSQHRPLSIQEVKRTQGYRDHEPIIGTLNEQWRILGNGVDRKVSFAIGLALRDAFAKSNCRPWTAEDLEDDAELVVDVKEEANEPLSEASERSAVDLRRAATPASSVASSTDSFSSTRETRQRFDMSLALGGAWDDEPPEGPPPVTPQRPVVVEAKVPLTEGLLSRPSRTVSTDIGRLSLLSFPTFLPSALQSFTTKRQRNDGESGDQHATMTAEKPAGPSKRARTAEVRRTTSPIRTIPEREIKREDGRASLPPLSKSNRTRRSGAPDFAPKAWHRKVGAPDNVIDLS